jgi:hypothetical protein
MNISQKTKVKKIKGEKVPMKERLGGLMFTVIAIIIAVVVFIGFVFLQNFFTEKISYKQAFVVKTEIPAGEILTEENIQNYFGLKEINALDAVESAYTADQYQELIGQRAKVTLHVNEEVSPSDFENVNVYLDYIENPVEMSIATSGIATTNGGKIRAGDIVNITLMFTAEQLGIKDPDGQYVIGDYEDTPNSEDELLTEGEVVEETTTNNKVGSLTPVEKESEYNFELYARYMLENIYIEKVLTADGVEIAPTDTESAAGIIVLVVPKDIELKLNNILANCSTMRISKVLYEITPEDLYKDPTLKEDVTATLEELEPTQEVPEVEFEEVDFSHLPEEGWNEVEGINYYVGEEVGVWHYAKDADGTITKEDCVLKHEEPVCEYCTGHLEDKTEETVEETVETTSEE